MDHDVAETGQNYTVVARRYRPRAFDQLIGQDHVSQALGKAISTGRVGHAYLFTGARGVGKTSTARIFAKALNTQEGTSAELVEEISQAIDSGDDMDVIEIDGASNRGIDEIRQLRANVNVRPSRSRFKIYIIDEVHMLTNQAFNALLKTLEEPPGHVKFIFCTTDPDKIPITVLSRCQRFDFVPVKFEAIHARLKEIAIAEGYTADDEALGLLARRAAGSMRDSQSLLEQVMSFSGEHITLEQVNTLLGTADEGRLLEIAEALKASDALASLQLIADAIQAGSDPGQLAEQLLNFLRDLMAVGVGGGPDILKLANPTGHAELKTLVDAWGVQTILSAIQILDETLVRMRSSVSATTLFEVALVQICQLDQLANIPALLELISHGPKPAAAASPEKKNIVESPPAAATSVAPPANTVAAKSPAAPVSPPSSVALGTGLPANTAATPIEVKTPGSGSAENVAPTKTPVDATPAVAAAESKESPAAEVQAESPAAAEPPAAEPPAPEPPAASVAMSSSSMMASVLASVAAKESPSSESTVVAKVDTGTVVETKTPAGVPAVAAMVRGSAHALETWLDAIKGVDGMLADFAAMARAVETESSDCWKILFPPGAQRPVSYCESSERRAVLQQALERKLGRPIQLKFANVPGEVVRRGPAPPVAATRNQKMREVALDPYVKKLCDTLEAEIMSVEPPRLPPPSSEGT